MTELVTSGSVGGMVQQWLSLPGHGLWRLPRARLSHRLRCHL